ncbi:MAG: hypothetical protein FWF59_15590 [Turicibacter sp.]|nr:hypothetical protein [Turicibacter sp.]
MTRSIKKAHHCTAGHVNCTIKKSKDAYPSLGSSKGLFVFTSQYGDEPVRYCYANTTEKFERPHQFAYEVWLEPQKSSKAPMMVALIPYYDLALGCNWRDYLLPDEYKRALLELRLCENKLDSLIDAKIGLIQHQAMSAWNEGAEAKAIKKNAEILSRYQENKKNFEVVWGYGTYDFIFDVFGNLRNEEFLQWVQELKAGQKKMKDNPSFQYKKNQQKKQQAVPPKQSFNDSEKAWLKKFYRTLAHEYHPDSGGETEAMILINKLKNEWDV